jgi:hypothetical protein
MGLEKFTDKARQTVADSQKLSARLKRHRADSPDEYRPW